MDALFPTPQPPHFSYWEITSQFRDVDLCIIGSGIVGLSTAFYCQLMRPSLRILVLERGSLPAGASTKNAGFACIGSASELLADFRIQSEEEVMERVRRRFEGLQQLRHIFGDKELGYEACGGFELFAEEQEDLFEQCRSFMDRYNPMLKKFTGLESTFVVDDQRVGQFGFRGVTHMVHNRAEGSVRTDLMMNALLARTRMWGVSVINGLNVVSVSEDLHGVSIVLGNGHVIRAGMAHVATNGFAKELLKDEDVQPARAQVLVTTPIDGLKVQGTFHLEEGYYYFRNVDNRILLGGGRNLDLEGETTSETGITAQIQLRLENLLTDVILPGVDFSIAHRWSGVMGVGTSKDTLLKRISPHLTCGVRLGGMGVALGTLIGKESAEMILGAKAL
jgi:gamma-glutamylputrescine oxidase